MTENNQTMSLEDITRALTELAQHVEAIRGSESKPELDPNDPLNEIMGDNMACGDASAAENLRARSILDESGKPLTIRNFLKALMSKDNSDNWYTIFSPAARKQYRIHRVYPHRPRLIAPDGTQLTVFETHDFAIQLPAPGELTAGWTIDGVAKVLDVFEEDGKLYTISEMCFD